MRKDNFHFQNFSSYSKSHYRHYIYKKSIRSNGAEFNRPNVYFKDGNSVKQKYFPKNHPFSYTYLAEIKNKSDKYGYYIIIATDLATNSIYRMYGEINKEFTYISSIEVLFKEKKKRRKNW